MGLVIPFPVQDPPGILELNCIVLWSMHIAGGALITGSKTCIVNMSVSERTPQVE